MAVNQGPNAQLDVDQFSTGVKDVFDTLQEPSISNLTGTPASELIKRSGLLRGMVNDVNHPILRGFAKDMLGVMASWLDDPKVLCCLIQGIYSAFLTTQDIANFKRDIGNATKDFNKFLDKMIAFIDFVIILLTQDIKRMVFLIPDFIKEIMIAIMGAILLLIQETAFALRDSILKVIFEWMDTWDREKTWSRCLPLKQMINVLKKYISDYGILAEIFEKTKGYLAGLRNKFAKTAKDLTPNVKDLEFLYWLRDLLIKLKRATLNFDLCVDYEFTPTKGTSESADYNRGLGKTAYVTDINDPNREDQGDINNQQGYTTGSDGSILIDRDKVVNGNWVPRVSNSFLREFIHKEYNIPYDVIDNTITRGTSGDHIQGSDVTSTVPNTILDRCANTPTAEETVKWILNIKSRL